jgi:hypothetical protein
MNLLRLLAISLLLSASVLPAHAQSSPRNTPFTSPLLDGLDAPAGFRTHVPALATRPAGQSANTPFQLSPAPNRLKQPQLAPPPILGQTNLGSPLLLERLGQMRVNLSRGMNMNQSTCYAIRDYRFSRDTPDSDVTHLAESSTCQLATAFHAKSAAVFEIGLPR